MQKYLPCNNTTTRSLSPKPTLIADCLSPLKTASSLRVEVYRGLEDTLENEGIVGTFCRAMGTIEESIEKYLRDIYEEAERGRYHFRAGVLLYDHKWAYSNYATDFAYHIELCLPY